VNSAGADSGQREISKTISGTTTIGIIRFDFLGQSWEIGFK
jgi:hypothetical protein